MKKYILLLISFTLISNTFNSEEIIFKHFENFIEKYNKKYSSIEEYLGRFQIFKLNYLSTKLNSKKSYKIGITKFSDLSQQEFAKTYLNLNYNAMVFDLLETKKIKNLNNAPESYDWREHERVGRVKDQGQCGSCWAFATMANLEGLYAEHYKNLESFSEQMLVDCDTIDSGCNGGLMQDTFNWLKSHGIMLEKDYPYTGIDDTCKEDPTKYIEMKVTGYKKLGSSTTTWSPVDENEIKEFLYKIGPLAIALNATPLQSYISGILDLNKEECPISGINHAVTLVGYGYDEESGLDYWLVKNSWGSVWGEKGYFRINRGSGTCGINCYITTAEVSF